MPVPIEIGCHYSRESGSSRVVSCGLECSIAFSKQDTYLSSGSVGGSQIELTVMVEVSSDHRNGTCHQKVKRRLKRSVSISQKYLAVSDQIHLSIAIEIAGNKSLSSRWIAARLAKLDTLCSHPLGNA